MQESSGARGGGTARRGLLALVVLGALTLHLPMWTAGFYADDHLIQVVLRSDDPVARIRPWALYDFGAPEDWAALDPGGSAFPWWTSPDWSVRFFRPLTSLSIWLDHALWGERPLGYAATSALLYTALLLLLHSLYRRLGLSAGTALGALALFAVSDTGVLPVGWLANRNTLLALLFTVVAVRAVSGEGRSGDPRAVLAGLVAAALAACCKESGVLAFALVAVRLVFERRALDGARARRVASIGAALCVVLALGYVLFLVQAGYGTSSRFYVTPWREPMRFAGRVAILASLGSLSLVGPVPMDALAFHPPALVAASVVSLLVVVPLVVWIARGLRGQPAAGYLALWTVLGLPPEAGAPPSTRLLFAAAVGSAGLLALFFAAQRRRLREGRLGRGPALTTRGLAIYAVLGSVAFTLLVGVANADLARMLRRKSLETDVGSPELGRREVIILQGEGSFLLFAMPQTWAFESDDHDLSFWFMQLGRRGLRWTRVDERTFDLESLDEPFLTGMMESVYLVGGAEPREGQIWQKPCFTVEARTVDEHGLRAIRVRLRESLDAPTVRFLVPRDFRLVAIEPPRVGESVELKPPEAENPLLP